MLLLHRRVIKVIGHTGCRDELAKATADFHAAKDSVATYARQFERRAALEHQVGNAHCWNVWLLPQARGRAVMVCLARARAGFRQQHLALCGCSASSAVTEAGP